MGDSSLFLMRSKRANMKTIGLLGGLSYPTTVPYYLRLNQLYQAHMGGHHSCPIILYNIDYHNIRSSYKNEWEKIPDMLEQEIEALLQLNPSCYMLCNNTLHKAYNQIESRVKTDIPFLHLIDLTVEFIQLNRIKEVLLLGTKFTMEDSYFRMPLVDAGITVHVPNAEERELINNMQERIERGEMNTEISTFFQDIADKYNHVPAVILACTELPLAFAHVKSESLLIDTIELQCQKAIQFLIKQ